MSRSDWTPDRVPRLDGRTFVITGANSGLGFETARLLARAGGRVVLACRSREKSEAALAQLRAQAPGAELSFAPLDLASLQSVRACAAGLLDRLDRIDALINNAGVMALPLRRTADGFEMQLGTNHLGHFALTGLLFARLRDRAPSRVVTVSSVAHRSGVIDLADPNWNARRYGKWAAYGQSKLANLLFSYELDRRVRAAGIALRAVACHPGYAGTNLQFAGPAMEGSAVATMVMRLGNRLLSQSATMGALPTVFAAVDPDALSGDYIGPSGLAELAGAPRKVGSSARSRDPEVARRLWTLSEELTGVRFLDAPAAEVPRGAA